MEKKGLRINPVIGKRTLLISVVLVYGILYFIKGYVADAFYGDSLHHYLQNNIQRGNIIASFSRGDVFDSAIRIITFFATEQGEKPFYASAVSIVRIILDRTGIERAMLPCAIVNFFALAIIAGVTYRILKKHFSELSAILFILILAFNFDIFYHALSGYHALYGLAFMFAAIYFEFFGEKNRRAGHYLIGFFLSSAVVASPHALPGVLVLLGLKYADMIKNRNRADNQGLLLRVTLGCATPFFYLFFCDFLRTIGGIDFQSFFFSLYKQGVEAQTMMTPIPIQPLFYLEYIFKSEGAGFALFFLGTFLAVPFIFTRLTPAQRKFAGILYLIAVLTYGIFTFGRYPTIARAYIPLSVSGTVLLAIMAGYLIARTKDKKRSIKILFTVMLSTLILWQILNFTAKYSFWVKHRHYNYLLDPEYKGKIVLKTVALTMPEMRDVYRNCVRTGVNMDNILIQTSASHKLGNGTYRDNCLQERYLLSLMGRGLRPYAIKERKFLINDIFSNEYFYYFFYKKNDYSYFKPYEFMKYFPWRVVISFRLSDIIKYDKSLEIPYLTYTDKAQ